MKTNITKENQDLLLGKNIANVATINPGGSSQVTSMWIDYDLNKNEILVNTAEG